jgi:hypothetical protein
MILIPLFIEKGYSPAGSMTPLPYLTTYTPIKSNLYFDSSFAIVISETLTFHVPSLMTIFLSLDLLSEESAENYGAFRDIS